MLKATFSIASMLPWSSLGWLLMEILPEEAGAGGRGGQRELFADKELNMDVNRKVSEEDIEGEEGDQKSKQVDVEIIIIILVLLF